MRIQEQENGLLLEGVEHFDAQHVFECGQCFRWRKEADNSYTGVAHGKVINVKSDYEKGIVWLKNTNRKDFDEIWFHYFDLGRDYGQIKERLSEDEILKEAIQYGRGIRILNQDPWELTISFIISANNNIPRISKSIELLSKAFGEAIIYEGNTYYSFPSTDRLAQAEFSEVDMCGTGYRCRYIHQSAKMINEGILDLAAIVRLSSEEAKKELLRLPGVGPKVADCILLFSMQKHNVYPVDVWVKRVTEHFYIHKDVPLKKIHDFARDKFGDMAGFAQQYLFYFARDQKLK